jgi:hypothetical protein
MLALCNVGGMSCADLWGYVNLPNCLISSMGTNATIECWTTWSGPVDQAWQRIYDLGSSNGGENISSSSTEHPYIFLTPQSGGNLVFGYQFSPPRVERRVNHNQPHPVNVETHNLLVWDGENNTVRVRTWSVCWRRRVAFSAR